MRLKKINEINIQKIYKKIQVKIPTAKLVEVSPDLPSVKNYLEAHKECIAASSVTLGGTISFFVLLSLLFNPVAALIVLPILGTPYPLFLMRAESKSELIQDFLKVINIKGQLISILFTIEAKKIKKIFVIYTTQ